MMAAQDFAATGDKKFLAHHYEKLAPKLLMQKRAKTVCCTRRPS
jgi:hypothetical protein